MKDLLKEKTTIAAFIGAAGVIVLLILLILKIITATDFGAAIGAWTAGIVTLVGAFAKDRD